MSKGVVCPQCGSDNPIIRNGRSRNGARQMFRCSQCHCRFTETSTYLRHRFPAPVIEQALQHARNGISYRGVKTLLYEMMDVQVSATTIYRWHKKFG